MLRDGYSPLFIDVVDHMESQHIVTDILTGQKMVIYRVPCTVSFRESAWNFSPSTTLSTFSIGPTHLRDMGCLNGYTARVVHVSRCVVRWGNLRNDLLRAL